MSNQYPRDISPQLKERMAQIRLLVLDVDGILTDGQVTYTSHGEELKSFNIKDGLGIKLAQNVDIQVAIITGRASPMVERRAGELGIHPLFQGREDKGSALHELASDLGIAMANIAYAGDDLPDLGAMQLAGIALTVADAHPEVLRVADWVSPLNGGKGAVRQMCDQLIHAKDQYQSQMASYRGAT